MTLREGVPYVAAAYLAVWVVVVSYVALIGSKLRRIERDLDRLEASIPHEHGAGPPSGQSGS